MAVYYVMRHGQTPLNDQTNRLYPGEQLRGDTDFPLDATGKAQAHAAGRLLLNRGILQIATSQLQRTLETALIVQTVLGVPVSIDSGLDTWSLGLYSGLQVTPELDTQIQWYEDHPDERPPGGETYNDSIARIEAAILNYEQVAQSTGPLLLVTHGRILYALEHVRSGRVAPVTDDGAPDTGDVIQVTVGVPGFQVVKLAAVETIYREALDAR